MPDNHDHSSGSEMGGTGMMVLMMGMCLGVLLLLVLIPNLGWPLGLVVGAVGLAAMLITHHWFMRGRGS